MPIHSPPPLHTPEPPSPFRTTKAQWHIVQHYLHSSSLTETLTTDTRWLHTIDPKVLLTTLIKKRAELDLLTSEADHAHDDIDLQFPNYHVGIPLRQTTSATSSREQGRGGEGFGVSPPSSSRDSGRSIPIPINTRERASTTSRIDSMSPLSPSFGPRRNDIFSGTVSRRRSLPHEARSIGEESDPKTRAARDWERRVQWEAAWREIERNLDEYIERFGSSHREEGRREMDNIDLWQELVALRVEGERLGEKIRGAVGYGS